MAAVDYFLKIDGIEGESKDAKHQNEIEVQSFRWGAKNTGSMAQGGGGGSGKVVMKDFHFTTFESKASPKLMVACASGQHIASATFTARKAGKDQQDYMKIVFTDIIISSYRSAGGDVETKGGIGNENAKAINPFDTISFNFTQIDYTYKEQLSTGSLGPTVKGGFDLKKMQSR